MIAVKVLILNRKSKLLKAGVGIGLVLAASLAGAPDGWAQNVQRIAAIVNDEVISGYDIEQRIALVIATTNLRDGPEVRRRLRNEVLRTLVDERLQVQEAKRFDIRVTDADLQRAYQFIATQNNVPPNQIDRLFASLAIPRKALEAQLEAEIAWSKLVRRRVAPNVRIGEDEVSEVLARLNSNAGQPEFRVSEIFLPVDSPEQADQVRQTAYRLLEQIRSGASFSAMARQFSRGSTAGRDGAVGWLQPGQISREFAAALGGMSNGEVSEPVRGAGGYYLLQLHERRQIMGSDPMQIQLALMRLLIPVPPGSDAGAKQNQRELAQTVRDSVRGCDEVMPIAKELQVEQAGDLGVLRLGEMPDKIRGAVEELEIGVFSEPIDLDEGYMLLMVCERVEPESNMPTREDIEESLLRSRVTMLAQRYLRDLRRDAIVELR